ncbi:MAG: DNA polymerase III subunit beta [Mesorhizobium sp.]|nr:MAG: DNA polymerase III subunit beta [Mesorhizobium sp.]
MIVAREALLPALALVKNAVERRSTIPVLQNMLLAVDAAAGHMTVTGTDLDCELRTSLTCQAGKDASFTLPSTLLHDAVRKMPDGVEIAIVAEKDFATVSAGRSKFRIQLLPATDFPVMADVGFSHSFEAEARILKRMLDTVGFAISTEETRYYLNGIHWHVSSGDVGAAFNAVATDGHRLAKFAMPIPDGADGMPAIIVPRHTVDLIGKILSDAEEGDGKKLMVRVAEHRLRLEAGDTMLTSKLIDGSFPDYQRVIPAGNANHFTLDRDTLAKAVDRVSTVSIGRGSAVKFAFDPEGALTLTTNNPDAGSANDEVSIENAEGSAVEIGFNGKYCLDMLGAAEGKRLTFSLGDAGSPALIQREEGGTSEIRPLFVLMPMRVS